MKRLLPLAVLALSAAIVGCHDDDHHGDPKGHIDHYHSVHGGDASAAPVGAMAAAPMMASAEKAENADACKVPGAAMVTAKVDSSGKVVTAGAPMTVTAAPVPVSEVLMHPEKYTSGPIKIEGNVASVCQKKGCWARLSDANTPAGKDLFVKFDCPEADDGRVLPLTVQGKPAVVEGTVLVTELSEAKARHYAKDAGMSEAEVNKIVGPQKQVTVSSPSVQVTMK